VVDVRGGHSSLLQEQASDSLAGILLDRFPILGSAIEGFGS
jgi:hypothetical protein